MGNNNFYLTVAFLIFSGCSSTEIVRKQYEPSKMIVVKYSNSIIDSSAGSNRETAFSKAAFFCGKKKIKLVSESKDYRIVQADDFKEPFIDPEASPLKSGGDIYLAFRCEL